MALNYIIITNLDVVWEATNLIGPALLTMSGILLVTCKSVINIQYYFTYTSISNNANDVGPHIWMRLLVV